MIEQGTLEWYRARFGLITMSDRIDIIISGSVHQLNNLIRDIKWEQSINADAAHVQREYEREMAIGDRVTQLAWGRRHEQEALAQYELVHNAEIIRPGFRTHELWPNLVGDSTDFIETRAGSKRTGEVKCYHDQANHLRALRYGMDPKHYNQVQGHMECWRTIHGVFISYDPRHPIVDQQLYVQAIERDEEWAKVFHARMTEFAKHFTMGTKFEFAMSGARDGIPSLF